MIIGFFFVFFLILIVMGVGEVGDNKIGKWNDR